MALRIKRGTNAERLTYTPELGEMIYVTDYSSAGVSPVWIGDGSTAGGNAVDTGGGGGGGLADIVSDTTPQLGGNLDLNSYDITGTGDININGDIDATGSIDVDLNIDAGGYVNASTMAANSFTGNITGDVTGDVTGSVFADDSSLIIDGIDGSIQTNSIINSSSMTIEHLSAQTVVKISTVDDRSILKLVRKSDADLTGDISSQYGALFFERDDANGSLSTGVILGRENALYFGNSADGDISAAANFFVWRDNKLGVGKVDPTEVLDVVGNAAISGSVTADAFKGTFVADDSSILVDGVAGRLILGNNAIDDLGDVITSNPQAGQVLKYNGSEWVNDADVAGSGGGGIGNIGVGADDSAVRLINSGESFLILGAGTITTSSNAEGDITITGTTELLGDTTPQLGGNLDVNNNNITFADATTPGTDNTLILGAGNDLELYHDGTHSYVSDTGTGSLRVLSNSFEVRNAANNEVLIDATEDGTTRLYYDGSSKLLTTTNGVTVVGTLSANVTGDITGSVFADDSSLIIDGNNGTIQWSVLAGTPTTLSGYGITDAATSAQGTLADTAIQPADLGNIVFTGSNIDTSDSSGMTITPSVTVQSDVTVENDLYVTNKVVADTFESTSTGTPEITAAANLNLTAGNAVVITQSPVRFASFTSTERDALASQNGDMIYNTTTNKFQGYANSTWVDLH